MTVINCTPHPIVVRTKKVANDEAGCLVWEPVELTFPPSGTVPRVRTIESSASSVEGIPCVTQRAEEIEGLPEEDCDKRCADDAGNLDPFCDGNCEGQVFLIVSQMVFAASDRKDLICPNTDRGAIRDGQGRIVATTRFVRKER